MAGGPGANDAPHTFSDEGRDQGQDPLGDLGELERRAMLAWVGENLTEVRRTAAGERPVYWVLGLGLVLGFVAYVGGYLSRRRRRRSHSDWLATCSIRSATHSGPVSSWSCSSRSSLSRNGANTRALDAYEAASREEAGARSDETSPDR